MDARLPPPTQTFDDRMRKMKKIVNTIKSISYQPVQDEALLALVKDIKQNIILRLLDCYGHELNNVDTSPPSSFLGCLFAPVNWNPERREKKVLMSKVLMDACQAEFSSLLQINYFLTLLIEMKISDEFIDPGKHRFYEMITSREINQLMGLMRTARKTLDDASSHNFKELHKEIFYLKILNGSFSEGDVDINNILSAESDTRIFFGDKDKELLIHQLPKLEDLYDLLGAQRKKRLQHTLEYELFSDFKEENLINVVRVIAIVEVLHCFIDELEVKQKKFGFKLMARLNAISTKDAFFSGAQTKKAFCLEMIRGSVPRHLDITMLRDDLDSLKDWQVDQLDVKQLFDKIRGVIGKHADIAYKFPKPVEASSSACADKDDHINVLIERERLNPHLESHHEQVLFSQEWSRELHRLSDELLNQLTSVNRLVDEFFIPQNVSRKDASVRDLDNLLDGILKIIAKHAPLDASPSVVRKLNFG